MKLADARKDHYRRLAHEQGFRARSAFKLKELKSILSFNWSWILCIRSWMCSWWLDSGCC